MGRSRINSKDKKKTMSYFQCLIFSIQYCGTHRFRMVNENEWPQNFFCLPLQKQENLTVRVRKLAMPIIVVRSCTL